MTDANENLLGAYLKSRRAKLEPTSLGLSVGRRRTPGLRREEVAQRARISPTWYTCLEQGRGGSPSADVLDRIARALVLSPVEREHLFVLGLGRLPAVEYRAVEVVPARLQRLLDELTCSPAMLRTPTWDVVAWNRATSAVLCDFDALAAGERNMLRLLFGDPAAFFARFESADVAQFMVGAFRREATRAGATAETEQLVHDLCSASPDFAAMWRENDLRPFEGDPVKRLRHPVAGLLELETSVFAVDGRPDLQMIVMHPATPADRNAIRSLLAKRERDDAARASARSSAS